MTKKEIREELLDIEGIKRSNKPILDLFIRRTAVVTSTPEAVTEKIVKDQWKKINELTRPNSQITEFDLPNIGCFFISKNKATKRLNKLMQMNSDLVEYPERGKDLKTKREVVIERNNLKIKQIKFKTKQNED